MTPSERLEAISLHLERATGYDSIPTIEDKYDRAYNGSVLCPWPGCGRRTRGAESMWKHVHFQGHGRSFGLTFNELASLSDAELAQLFPEPKRADRC